LQFYETVLATSLHSGQFGPETLAAFPYAKSAVSGCVVQGNDLAAGAAGSVIYLNLHFGFSGMICLC
jgi:predicted enzyme related to lactoylglutathione lyase